MKIGVGLSFPVHEQAKIRLCWLAADGRQRGGDAMWGTEAVRSSRTNAKLCYTDNQDATLVEPLPIVKFNEYERGSARVMEEKNNHAAESDQEQAGMNDEPKAPDPGEDGMDGFLRKPDTALLSPKNAMRRNTPIQVTGSTASLGENREIILVIRGMVERLVMKESQPVILGRSDMRTRYVPDVDLTPYGALDRGVSREHSRLNLEGDHLYITDLDSTNGTFLSGKKLDPNVPTLIRKGDELLLGRLAVQILFR